MRVRAAGRGPSDSVAVPLGPVDGCPCCAARDNEPCASRHAGDALVCLYRCAACGATWYTTWLAT